MHQTVFKPTDQRLWSNSRQLCHKRRLAGDCAVFSTEAVLVKLHAVNERTFLDGDDRFIFTAFVLRKWQLQSNNYTILSLSYLTSTSYNRKYSPVNHISPLQY